MILRLHARVRIHELVKVGLFIERVVVIVLTNSHNIAVFHFVFNGVAASQNCLLAFHDAQMVLMVRCLIANRQSVRQIPIMIVLNAIFSICTAILIRAKFKILSYMYHSCLMEWISFVRTIVLWKFQFIIFIGLWFFIHLFLMVFQEVASLLFIDLQLCSVLVIVCLVGVAQLIILVLIVLVFLLFSSFVFGRVLLVREKNRFANDEWLFWLLIAEVVRLVVAFLHVFLRDDDVVICSFLDEFLRVLNDFEWLLRHVRVGTTKLQTLYCFRQHCFRFILDWPLNLLVKIIIVVVTVIASVFLDHMQVFFFSCTFETLYFNILVLVLVSEGGRIGNLICS